MIFLKNPGIVHASLCHESDGKGRVFRKKIRLSNKKKTAIIPEYFNGSRVKIPR